MAAVPDVNGPVVMVAVLGADGGQQPFLQPGQRRGAQGSPPGRQHLAGRDLIRAVPGHQHQVTQHRGHHLGIVRVRQHAHQHGRADRERGRHRPLCLSFYLPGQRGPRSDLVDHPGSRQVIELLLERAQPGVISGMPGRLDPPVAADHRGRDDHDLHEQQLIPGPDHGGAGHHQRRAIAPGQGPAARRHQIRRSDRDDHRGTGQPSRAPASQASVVSVLT